MGLRKKSLKLDRYLVTEQPGMVVVVSGLIISFLIGYTFKSYLSPARVFANIEKAASHIHKDVKVTFTSAHLSLNDGILPRFAVVINDVKMESENKCWASPVLEVDELRLPLSVWGLLRGGPRVRTIEANKVVLTLRETVQDCAPPEIVKTTEMQNPSALVRLSPSEKNIKYQNDLRSLSVNEFKIVAEKHPQVSSELQQLVVRVKSFEPKVIELRAKTHLLKDQQVGDYLSHANLFVEYQESPQVKVQSHVFGNWREGHYSLIANYTFEDQRLAVEADLKHIPLSQILAILQKYGLASKELNGRQAWLSTKAQIVAPILQLRQSPLEIRDLRLEGDLGELKVERVKVQSLEPLKYAPISVDIRKLDVAKLLYLLNRPKSSSILGELGVFSGRAEIQSGEKIKMSGEHRGLAFVFSNKGQQESQVLDRLVGDAKLSGNQWSFSIRRIEPRGGLFIGDVQVTADPDFRKVALRASVDEVVLAPAVQKLMTNGGSIGVLGLDVNARLSDGELSYLRGLARLEGMTVEGLSFGKAQTTIDWSQGEVILKSQVKSLEVDSASAAVPVLKQVTSPAWWTQEKMAMNSLTGTFSTKGLSAFTWKNVQGQVGKTGRFITEGAWDEVGSLKGSVYNREGKSQKKWIIEGDRENPIFVDETMASKGLRK